MEGKLNIAMFGHKRIPSREGGIEIVVEEIATRLARMGHQVTCDICLEILETVQDTHRIIQNFCQAVPFRSE